jgi:hypothetical protein
MKAHVISAWGLKESSHLLQKFGTEVSWYGSLALPLILTVFSGIWHGVFSIHTVASTNYLATWCKAKEKDEIHVVQTGSSVRIRIPFLAGVLETTLSITPGAEETIATVQIRAPRSTIVLFRVFDERLYIMDAYNRQDVCILAATRTSAMPSLPEDPSNSGLSTMWIALIASGSFLVVMAWGCIVYRRCTRKPKDQSVDLLDATLLVHSERGV